MKVLLNIGHPAHVHLFKNLIWEFEKQKIDFCILARDKDLTLNLLDAYGFNYKNIDIYRSSKLGKIKSFLKMDLEIIKSIITEKPDVLIAVGDPFIAHGGFLLNKISINFTDTENARLANYLTIPFISCMCVPSCFKGNFGSKELRYNGYHELAYLSPKYFTPDPSVLRDLNIQENEIYIVIRLVSWGASHDVGDSGLLNEVEMVRSLMKFGKVFISSEYELPSELKRFQLSISPEKMHHLLYYATLYLGESATMASESAILGTPAIFVSSSIRGYVTELEEKYNLAYTFSHPITRQNDALEKAITLLQMNNLKEKWAERRNIMLADKIEVTDFMFETITEIKNIKKD